MPQYVVCLCVRLSVCPSVRLSVTFRYVVHTGWNTGTSQINVSARADPNMGDLVHREHSENDGGIWVGS